MSDDLTKAPPHLIEAQRLASASVPRAKSFVFRWTDPQGHVWEGEFTSAVPSIGQSIKIAKTAASKGYLANGSLTDDVSQLIHAIAFLDEVLIRRPDWAKDLESLPFTEIIDGLSEEVMAHLNNFRGARTSQG